MARSHLRHTAFHLHQRAPDPQPFPVPDATIQPLPDLIPRDSTPTSSSTCGPNDTTGSCEKPVQQSTLTLPVSIGIAVPLGIALILFIVLHRRHVKKLRREDATDKHKSLDFGLHPANNLMPGRKNKKALHPDMTMEKSTGRGRGMSMDLGNPYMLPPGLASSHESLHSMSRTIHAGDDPYRLATDTDSIRSFQPSKRGGDDSSSYTAASSRFRQDAPTQNLISNAQRMSRSQPPAQRTSIGSMQGQPQIRIPPPAQVARKGLPTNPREGVQPNPSSSVRDSYTVKDDANLRRSNNYLAGLIHSRDPSVDQSQSAPTQGTKDLPRAPSDSQFLEDRISPPPPMTIPEETSRPPRGHSLASKGKLSIDTSTPQDHVQYQDYEDDYEDQSEFTQNVVPPSPRLAHAPYPSEQQGFSASLTMPDADHATPFYTPGEREPYSTDGGLDVPGMDHQDRRMSILRPLPPDEPLDNPEQRANRIRSFYKEYFDDSQPARTYQPAPETYYEDYGQEYQSDGTTFDPVSGQFIVAQAPFAQPITRRAMTPPPRAPPRFQGPGRHQYNSSNPGPMMPPQNRSRAASSASTSARFGPQTRGPPRRALPPPAPLRTLPTPHLLQEDAFALSIDFAPPSGYKDRQAGRPESPMMQMRPYSPSVRSHTPLVSAFDELASIPSPYQLRKSGNFTALDFAPPPRFKNSDTGSDAGSIRSGRSGRSGHSATGTMSAAQMHSLRVGAYRVSRIPKEVVGTKDEITNALKPQWNLRS
ncbi:hypothetical protein MMC30_000702 [Trapelia coarctata]|nr:hypothetical protein [Trapelia coarctata]